MKLCTGQIEISWQVGGCDGNPDWVAAVLCGEGISSPAHQPPLARVKPQWIQGIRRVNSVGKEKTYL